MSETPILLQNAGIITPFENLKIADIFVYNKNISEISDADQAGLVESIDLNELLLFAGFIDIHNHGAVGVDVNSATADDMRKVSRFLASKGVTAWLPTFVPDSTEIYQKGIDAIDEVMRTQDLPSSEPAARILGVHYEGIFANEKMCGALRPEFFKTFKGGEVDEIPKLKKGVHLTTLAPEIENGIDLIEKLIAENWVVSIGHTKAETEILDAAFSAGAKHLTHFYNAMTGLHHRDVGVVGWALMKENATFDIIADGVHVRPQMLEFACRSKSPENVTLISDSVLPTGLGDGVYELWDEKISVVNGKTQNERGSIAGSVITMLDAVTRMLSLGFSEAEVSKMASRNPAKLLGLEKTQGSIEIGKRADFVALDEAGNVKFVMIGGKIAVNNLE
ncbi:MAG: N-acetylglucosamine-6-phosphate deacetylase [Acidobacteriota bacterium]|nr:N-acetylglucosamine-6-phosphate deacetylase [Acidobacteriota bacterium]